jgi:hypothetical protein
MKKLCPVCKENKDYGEFRRCKRAKTGRMSLCKKCASISEKNSKEWNREHYRRYIREYMRSYRARKSQKLENTA